MREMQQIQISYQYDHERLYEALKRRGMTERALAEKIYCSPATVSRIFNGCGRLSIETIIMVCLALKSNHSPSTISIPSYDKSLSSVVGSRLLVDFYLTFHSCTTLSRHRALCQ